MTKSRHSKRTNWLWTPAQDALLRALYPDQRAQDVADTIGRDVKSIYHRARALGLAKSAEFYRSTMSGRLDGATHNPHMIARRFAAGHEPWNKGMKGLDIGGKQTRFQPGNISGHARRLWVPVGSYRINSEGVLDRKVTDLGQGPRDWEAVHRLVWKAAHGEVPKGHVVAFKSGRRTTVLEAITLDALECISRAELVRRNSIHTTHPELAPLVHLKGRITLQVNRIARQAKDQAT